MEKNENRVDVSTLKDFNLSPSWDTQEKHKFSSNKTSDKTRRKKEYPSKSRGRATIPESKNSEFFYSVLPLKDIIREIKQKIKETSISYSLREIADVIAEKTDRLAVKIVCKSKSKNLWQSKNTKRIYSEKDEAIHEILSLTKNKIIISVVNSEELPKGNFNYVLQCPRTQKLLPPTNFHDFKQIVEHHLLESEIRTSTDTYVNQLIKISDKDQIDCWSKEVIRRYSYKLVNDSEPVLYTLEKIRSLIEEKFETYFLKFNQIVVGAKEFDNLPNSINIEINNFLKNKKIWRKDFFISCIIYFKKSPFYSFKKGEFLYVRYNARKSAKGINANKLVNKIIMLISEKKNINKRTIVELLKTEEITTKEIIVEMKWLAKTGYINEYSDGTLDLN
ncbi:MAG: hypothetical protein P8N49_03625 [Opitutales bacterium]|nr:hypothetical protein [Opitutales bacterium]